MSKRKDLASFQIANGEERRRIMRVGARSGSNPGPFGSEPSALTICASCPLQRVSKSKVVFAALGYYHGEMCVILEGVLSVSRRFTRVRLSYG